MAKSDNENGVWLDRDAGKVVKKQPVRGRLLAAPGKEITSNVQAIIDRYEDSYATFEQATAPAVEETRGDKPAKKGNSKDLEAGPT